MSINESPGAVAAAPGAEAKAHSTELSKGDLTISSATVQRVPGVDQGLRGIHFQLVKFADIRPKAQSRDLIKGIIPRNGLGLVWGKPKCGKSFWALDIALHVASERNYRGHRTKGGAVVYIAAEGEHGQGARVEAARMHLGISDAEFYLLPKRLDLVKDNATLRRDIRSQNVSPVLIVVDTLNRTLTGSESSDQDMAKYIKAADELRSAFDCTVLLVHHCGHDPVRPRGHSSLPAAADVQISVTRRQDMVVSEVDFMKDGQDGFKASSRLLISKVGVDEDGEDITSCVLEPCEASVAELKENQNGLPKASKVALNALREAIKDEGVTPPAALAVAGAKLVIPIEAWRRRCLSMGISTGKSDRAGPTAFERAAERLAERGLAVIREEFVYILEKEKDASGEQANTL